MSWLATLRPSCSRTRGAPTTGASWSPRVACRWAPRHYARRHAPPPPARSPTAAAGSAPRPQSPAARRPLFAPPVGNAGAGAAVFLAPPARSPATDAARRRGGRHVGQPPVEVRLHRHDRRRHHAAARGAVGGIDVALDDRRLVDADAVRGGGAAGRRSVRVRFRGPPAVATRVAIVVAHASVGVAPRRPPGGGGAPPPPPPPPAAKNVSRALATTARFSDRAVRRSFFAASATAAATVARRPAARARKPVTYARWAAAS
ncbi:hypothetical protein BU14_0081s0007 [Porphyra umbilicalis]|uniref:Uncharacterized protein n=1 Tax=Porphyra umbilicalis TaxID=2786 RepID=A0A1X6PEP1_PORUM|nr:hypothetical protein BU14_0081s0007 [Porphyra umbilicalis]|eukprot:OSX79327.1 hypothetical protein BU14_0081s0007 [Porphyra umbilicalis]